jgi:mono/diheme cytochrome c family protein
MRILNWHGAAVVCLGALAAAGWLPAQDGSKAGGLPAGPTLVFDTETNECQATAEQEAAEFTFHATNVWTNAIVVEGIYPSCHCTVAAMPDEPWVLLPGASGAVTARVDLTDQEEGTVTKTLTLLTSVGERELTLKVVMPPLSRPPGAPLTEAERQAAMGKAAADAKAIFKGDCATCHVEKARGLLGKELYAAACGICHESPRRASFVPDLRALKQPMDYWKGIIARGQPHTVMPGFADAEGGPLSEMQVSSLAAYLEKAMPGRAGAGK